MDKIIKARPLFSKAALIKLGFEYTPMSNRNIEYHHTDKYFLCIGKGNSCVCIYIYQNFNLNSVEKKMDFDCTDVLIGLGYMEATEIYPKNIFQLRRLIASLNAVV